MTSNCSNMPFLLSFQIILPATVLPFITLNPIIPAVKNEVYVMDKALSVTPWCPIKAEYEYPATNIYTSGKATCQIKNILSIAATTFLYTNNKIFSNIIIHSSTIFFLIYSCFNYRQKNFFYRWRIYINAFYL